MKPQLAGTLESLESAKLPVLASVKFDGLRALVLNGRVVSRNMNEIPSREVQRLFSNLPEGTDGELVCGDPLAKDCFQKTMSACTDRDGSSVGLRFFAFDCAGYEGGFHDRLNALISWVRQHAPAQVEVIPQFLITEVQGLLDFEEAAVSQGWEGICLRSPNGGYRHGRSTLNSRELLKYKRSSDAEAIITGFEEQRHNGNPAILDAHGHTKRSSAKAGKVETGALGNIQVRGLNGKFKGVEFGIGGGFSQLQRTALWQAREPLIGQVVTFKYSPGYETRPRFPQFKAFRSIR